ASTRPPTTGRTAWAPSRPSEPPAPLPGASPTRSAHRSHHFGLASIASALLDRVATAFEARGKGTAVRRARLGLRLLCCAPLIGTPHAADQRSRGRADGSALPRITPDGSADCSEG